MNSEEDYFGCVSDFLKMKTELLTRSYWGIETKKELDGLIKDAEALELVASKAQLIRYRDHYYPKEEK